MYRRYYSETKIVDGVKKKISVSPGGYLEHQVAYCRRKKKAGQLNSDSESEEEELMSGIYFYTILHYLLLLTHKRSVDNLNFKIRNPFQVYFDENRQKCFLSL